MGRGLSPLQRRILTLAEEHDRLLLARILVDCYGLTANNGWRDPDRAGEQHFRVMNSRRYHAAYSAASRALRRLVTRGLLEQWSNGNGTWWALPGRDANAWREYLAKDLEQTNG